MMNKQLHELAEKHFSKDLDSLTEHERRIVQHLKDRKHVSRNTNREFEEKLTVGQKIADKIAAFGGSWTFILIYLCILFLWILANSYLLLRWGKPFDPYPYILLNLFLSMLASIQAPIILMSQNRQATKDRLEAAHDYEVNLKAEFEILGLHEKIDELREKKWTELLLLQQEEIQMLTKLLDKHNGQAKAANGRIKNQTNPKTRNRFHRRNNG